MTQLTGNTLPQENGYFNYIPESPTQTEMTQLMDGIDELARVGSTLGTGQTGVYGSRLTQEGLQLLGLDKDYDMVSFEAASEEAPGSHEPLLEGSYKPGEVTVNWQKLSNDKGLPVYSKERLMLRLAKGEDGQFTELVWAQLGAGAVKPPVDQLQKPDGSWATEYPAGMSRAALENIKRIIQAGQQNPNLLTPTPKLPHANQHIAGMPTPEAVAEQDPAYSLLAKEYSTAHPQKRIGTTLMKLFRAKSK